MTDPYKVLGVSRDASDDEIKKAYRAMSRKYHPDANINNPNKAQAEEMFKTVQQAYNQIMKEKESGGAYGSYGTGAGYGGAGYGGSGYGNTGAGNRGGYGYDGDNQQRGQQGGYGDYGDFGSFFGGFGPFGFGGYGGQQNQNANNMNGNDETTVHLRAAANYIRSGAYDEAINVLNAMDDRDGRWYFYSAQAHAGKGNQATALEYAKRAVELEPDNQQYQMLYRTMASGGEWYAQRGQTYGRPASNAGSFCLRLILLNLLCNLCGGGLCCGNGGYRYY
ncbi:MAG: DnaJ domain-containing protein [Lachnospira sp.]|nr:DnaJ domain-containing protein [Lachnospira sp.]